MYCLIVLEARSPRSRYQQGWFLLRVGGSISSRFLFLASSGLSVVFGIPLLSHGILPGSLHIVFPVLVSFCVQIPPFICAFRVFIAARGLSLVVASRGRSSLLCSGFSLQWLLFLQSTGSGRQSFSSCSGAVAHRPSSVVYQA